MDQNSLSALAADLTSGAVRIVDLSVTLSSQTPILVLPDEFGWGKSWPFSKEEISRYDERGPAWYWNNICCGEHTGTHFDAPIHWVTGKDHQHHATDTLPVENFVAPCVVIDAVAESQADPDFLMTVDFVKQWESEHGEIPRGAWVLYHTDWSKRESASDFLNRDSDGLHNPGWDPATVIFLAEERQIIGVGTETVGTDAGQASAQEPQFPCHNLMHGANKCGLASLANLDQLPPTGAILIAAPLKIEEGSGSPCRVLALVGASDQ